VGIERGGPAAPGGGGEGQASLDLEQGPLAAAVLCRLHGEAGDRLMLVVQNLIVDLALLAGAAGGPGDGIRGVSWSRRPDLTAKG